MKELIALLLLMLSSVTAPATSQLDNSLRVDNPTGGEVFLAGVYMYKSSDWTAENMETHLGYLASLGINLLHINSLNYYGSDQREVLALAKQHNMKIIYQIDSAYFTGTVQQSKVEEAISEINKYIDDDTVIAFNVKEEPSEGFIDELMAYYQEIYLQSGHTKIPFFLLHNQAAASEKIKEVYHDSPYLPVITGSDRYGFRFNFTSANGYIATPSKAFSFLNSSTIGFPLFYGNRVQGQSFIGAITSNANQVTYSKEQLASFAGCTVVEVDNGTCTRYNRWYSLATNNNHGLSLGPNPGEITAWSHYRPPHNAMSAQTWLAVANGSQATLAWSAQIGASNYIGLVESPGVGHYSLLEYSKTIGELKPFGYVLNRMHAYSTGTLQPQFVNRPSTDNSGIYERRFDLEGYAGDLVVLVNTVIGQWNGSNKDWLQDSDNYRIDSNGEVVTQDYQAFTSPEIVSISTNEAVYDLETGELINEVSIRPGGGRLLFVGTEEELNRLRNASGLDTVVMVGSELDVTSYYYINYDKTLQPNTNYELFVNARELPGEETTLGVKYLAYDSSNTLVESGNIIPWGSQLEETETVFSGTFNVTNPNVAYIRIAYYKVNNQISPGNTLVIKASWLNRLL